MKRWGIVLLGLWVSFPLRLPSLPLPVASHLRLIQTAAQPQAFDSMSGCASTNTGTPDKQWGLVHGDPVYTHALSLLIGKPQYTTNTLFWISRETKPGESVLLTGAFTPGPKTVRIAPIQLPLSGHWNTAVAAANSYPVTQQSPSALLFTIPSTFPPGEYGFEIVDPSANSFFSLANQPAIQWAVGTPSNTTSSYALQGEVTPCAVQPGGVLRIFGKNFSAATMPAILQDRATGAYQRLRATGRDDATAMSLSIPSSLAPGAYNLWLGSAPWSTASSNAVRISIAAPAKLNITRVTCALASGGGTDNTAALQNCLDKNIPVLPNLAYIAIPAGTYTLTGVVSPHAGEVLQGAPGPAKTEFLLSSPHPPRIWFNLPDHFGMTDISLQGSVLFSIFSSLDQSGNPATSGHLYFNDVTVTSHFVGLPSRGPHVIDLYGPDIQFYNSKLFGDAFELMVLNMADGAVISGNNFRYINWTGNSIGNSQNVIWENNTISSPNAPLKGTTLPSLVAGSGLQVTRAFVPYHASLVNQNIYVGYNTISNTGIQGQQIVTVDGGGGGYFGPVDPAAGTASTTVLANDPSWVWTGDTNPQTLTIAISSGTGVGQFSTVKSHSGRRISLMTPWKVLPDATSVVVITGMQNNLQMVHNTITNTLGATLVLGDSADSVIEDNTLTNSGDGILIAGFGPYGSPASYNPVEHLEVLRNVLNPGLGTYITQSRDKNMAGIGIVDFPGIVLSGILIRGNKVPEINTIFPTDGWSLYSGVLIERNYAIWFRNYKIPGLTVQNNFAPVN